MQSGMLDRRLAQQAALAKAAEDAKWRILQATFQNQRERDQYLQGQQNTRTAANIQSREKSDFLKSEQGKIAQWYDLYRNQFGLSHEDALANQRINTLAEQLRSDEDDYYQALNANGYKKAFESLGIYRKMVNREYTFDEGKTELVKAMFRLKYGREPSGDETIDWLKKYGY